MIFFAWVLGFSAAFAIAGYLWAEYSPDDSFPFD